MVTLPPLWKCFSCTAISDILTIGMQGVLTLDESRFRRSGAEVADIDTGQQRVRGVDMVADQGPAIAAGFYAHGVTRNGHSTWIPVGAVVPVANAVRGLPVLDGGVGRPRHQSRDSEGQQDPNCRYPLRTHGFSPKYGRFCMLSPRGRPAIPLNRPGGVRGERAFVVGGDGPQTLRTEWTVASADVGRRIHPLVLAAIQLASRARFRYVQLVP